VSKTFRGESLSALGPTIESIALEDTVKQKNNSHRRVVCANIESYPHPLNSEK